ncbi:MAG TPA: septum formation family protein [Acidimicrobiia bacterium]|nr:septum formation family protein [Acidimicrobiia bacterium]
MRPTGLLLVTLALFFTACAPALPERDASGLIIEEAEMPSSDLREGDCFSVPGGLSGGEIERVVGVPCAQEHDFRVVGVVDVTADDHPGQSALDGLALDACPAAFVSRVGAPFHDSEVAMIWLTPTGDSWRAGARTIQCIVSNLTTPVRDGSGAIIGGGESTVFGLRQGDCYNDPTAADRLTITAVLCAEPHDNEIFHRFTLPAGPFPGESAQADIDAACLEAFENFTGAPHGETPLEFFTDWPTEKLWDMGDRDVHCVLFASNGSKLTGSMAGSGA